jgi:hypothetical protein
MAIYVSFVTAPYAAPGTEIAMLLLYNGLEHALPTVLWNNSFHSIDSVSFWRLKSVVAVSLSIGACSILVGCGY